MTHAKERVGETFSANGRCRAVPGVDPYIVPQGKDLFDNPFNELLMVSSCEVSPSYGTRKECVTCKDSTRCTKTHPARGVTRGVDSRNRVVAHLYFLTILEETVRWEI